MKKELMEFQALSKALEQARKETYIFRQCLPLTPGRKIKIRLI